MRRRLLVALVTGAVAWSLRRFHDDRASWTEHVGRALADEQPPGPCEAVIDRRLFDGCAHVQPGQTTVATVRIADHDMRVCSGCFATYTAARRDINDYMRQHGVREAA